MTLADVVDHLGRLAPPATAEAWDNVGLLVGDPAADVRRAMLCIDYTAAVAAEARAAACELVVAYHPPLFKPINRLTAEGRSALLFDAARRGVAIYSPHTALDVAVGGTNDVLGDILGLIDRRPLRPATAGADAGIGRVGRLDPNMERAALFEMIKSGLGIDRLLLAGPHDGVVHAAAVCAGAGGDLLDNALAAGVDLFLTGELRHHDALRAAAAGVTVVCTLHSHSERVTLRYLAERLTKELPEIAWQVSTMDVEPFSIV